MLFNTLITENTTFNTIIYDNIRHECEVIDFSADVMFLPAPQITVLDTVICDDQSVLINNQQIDTSVELLSTVSNHLACDSIVTNITVNVLPHPIENLIDTFVCEIDLPLILQQRDTLPNYLGCDYLYNEMNYRPHETLKIELIDTLTAVYSEEITLNFTANKSLNIIEWNGQNLSCLDCINPTITALENETISLYVQDTDGCDTTLPFIVVLTESDPEIADEIYEPNIISPNSESLNCCFYIQSNETLKIIYDLDIYDRWGNVVFEKQNIVSNRINSGWDGTKNGNFLEQGVYVYKILVKRSTGDESYFGDITLVR